MKEEEVIKEEPDNANDEEERRKKEEAERLRKEEWKRRHPIAPDGKKSFCFIYFFAVSLYIYSCANFVKTNCL